MPLLCTEDSTIRRLVPEVKTGCLKERTAEGEEPLLMWCDAWRKDRATHEIPHVVTKRTKGSEHLMV
jgi:hypothetical protein